MNSIKTYVNQEEFSVPKILIGVLLSIIWAFAFAFVYGVLMAMSPLIYINFLITCVFGLVLSVGVAIISKLIKNTFKKTELLMSGVAAIFGLYFSWAAYFLYLIDSNAIFENYFQYLLLIKEPLPLIENLIGANEFGLWSIFGIPFKGTILWLVWLLEAGIIIFISMVNTSKRAIMPYSSKNKAWYKKSILYKDFASVAMQDDFCAALANNCEETIDGLELGKAYHYARISIYYLEGETQQYISVENVTKEDDGKKENSNYVIHLLSIKTTEAENLIKKYHAKKQSFIASLM